MTFILHELYSCWLLLLRPTTITKLPHFISYFIYPVHQRDFPLEKAHCWLCANIKGRTLCSYAELTRVCLNSFIFLFLKITYIYIYIYIYHTSTRIHVKKIKNSNDNKKYYYNRKNHGALFFNSWGKKVTLFSISLYQLLHCCPAIMNLNSS